MKKGERFSLFLILSVLLFLFSFNSFASGSDTADYLTVQSFENDCVIVDCKSTVSGDLIIPKVIDGKKVTRIGDQAFDGCGYITSVILPDTVIEIGAEAFAGCDALVSVNMSDSVEQMGSFVFAECKSLSNVRLSDNLTSIPEGSFYRCEKLTAVKFPANLKFIGENAFADCKTLEKVVLSESTESLAQGCFYGCTSLESIYIPATVESLSKDAFEGCMMLSQVYYEGNNSDFNSISIGSGNTCFEKARIFYNHIHSAFSDVTTVEPDCTISGYREYLCLCGYKGYEEIPSSNAHKLSITEIIRDSDCSISGIRKLSCSECDYSETEIISPKGHKGKELPAVEATCKNAGKTQGLYCSACGEIIKAQSSVPALKHKYTKKIKDSKHLASKATYSKAARYYYSCSDCGKISPDKTFNGEKLVLGKVSGITFTSSSDSVTLGWNKISKARGYAVYQKNSKGKWSLLKRVRKTSVKINELSKGKRYEFAIKAYVVENSKVVYAPHYSVIKAATSPSLPSSLTVKQSDTAVTLSWNKVKNADGYRVYRYDSKGRKWVTVRKSLTNNKLTVKNLESGKRYKFAVRAYIDTDKKLVFSEKYKSITTATRPSTPIVRAKSYKDSVRLEWDSVKYADGYAVYVSLEPDSGFRKIKNTTSLSFKAKNLKATKKYYFKVYAYRNVSGKNIYSYSKVKTVRTR